MRRPVSRVPSATTEARVLIEEDSALLGADLGRGAPLVSPAGRGLCVARNGRRLGLEPAAVRGGRRRPLSGTRQEVPSMEEFELPLTRYALSGDVSIAYQTIGEGPIDLVIVPGMISHVEFAHEFPGYTQFLRRLAKFARVVTFDKRGQGLSDRVPGTVPLEQRMDDLNAIMRDIGSSRAALFGFSEGSAMSALFAATYPDRVSHLLLFGGFAKRTYPEESVENRVRRWGEGDMINIGAPSLADNPEMVRAIGKLERLSASPGSIRAFMQLIDRIDVRPILSTIRTPTLVLHRETDIMVPIEFGREYAENIPGARFIAYARGD